ncbi:hypothetical protein K438DRAFT_2127967 [Mycena galopus ATCC 62051]|nr:hypothetical protein K438DRAFT_2127967 [Mycena galopus ATCC 62051]
MRLILALLLFLLHRISAQASQRPFHAVSPRSASSNADLTWDLGASPDTNCTASLIFDTVNSLLQHWPNTRYRNGHNVVPGFIPVGTLLYHGRSDSALPTFPEWTATDPEHAFPWCGDSLATNDSVAGCWQLTLVATRPLKVLYFDGTSAAKLKNGHGPLDAQDLIAWGKIDPTRALDERARINHLCAWGKDFGIDGYLRMEMDFEVMLCDFFHGVELVAADYLAAWTKAKSAPLSGTPPPHPIYKNLFLIPPWVFAGSWHNRFPGETRVHLDLTGLVSFYDISLAPSLVSYREGTERWDHCLRGLSAADSAAVKKRLREVLSSGAKIRSGIDWKTLYRVLVDRYAIRLETLGYLLDTTNAVNLHERATVIQTDLRIILTPYILYSARPDTSTHEEDMAWAVPVWHACATRLTAHIHGNAILQSRLTPSERMLLTAIDGTNREICRIVVRMWTMGVHLGLDAFIPGREATSTAALLSLLGQWRNEAQSLIAWLDWSIWIKCRPACSPEEMCYLPTWPYFERNDPEGKDDGWRKPQSRCIRKFEPYAAL